MIKRAAAFALAAALLASGAQAAVTAPKVSISSYAQLKTPLPLPYDEKADADKVVAAAKAKARKQGKILILDLGGNWCPDCRILAGTVELPEMKAFIDKHFVMATVDVGRFDKNLQIPAHYGITTRLPGAPSMLIIDPRTDKLLNDGKVGSLSDARHMSPQGLADYLAQWAK